MPQEELGGRGAARKRPQSRETRAHPGLSPGRSIVLRVPASIPGGPSQQGLRLFFRSPRSCHSLPCCLDSGEGECARLTEHRFPHLGSAPPCTASLVTLITHICRHRKSGLASSHWFPARRTSPLGLVFHPKFSASALYPARRAEEVFWSSSKPKGWDGDRL